MSEKEAEWRAEFEGAGEEKVRSMVDAARYDGPKSEFAVRWLRDQTLARRTREKVIDFWAWIGGIFGIIVGAGISAWPIIKGWLSLLDSD